MKYKYKKLLYLLGLTSMLTLNSCSNDNEEKFETNTEISDENIETDKSDCNHLDEDSLEIKTLSDGSKYVSAANFFYSKRENFLDNNRIIEIKGVNNTYDYFLTQSEYLPLFSNSVIQDIINSSECSDHIRYLEDTDNNSFGIFIDTPNYDFSLNSYLADYETIKETFTKENVSFDKYLYSLACSDWYYIRESYTLSSDTTSELNKIDVIVKSEYRIDFNKSSDCRDFSGSICLNSSMNELEATIDEEKFYELTSLLAAYAEEDKTVEQFLEENDELMKELFGLEYEMFIEDINSMSYTLTKPTK